MSGFLVIDCSRLFQTASHVLMVDQAEEGPRRLAQTVQELNSSGNFRRWLEPKDPEKRIAGIVVVAFSAIFETTTAGITAHRWMQMGPLHPGTRRGKHVFDRLRRSIRSP